MTAVVVTMTIEMLLLTFVLVGILCRIDDLSRRIDALEEKRR